METTPLSVRNCKRLIRRDEELKREVKKGITYPPPMPSILNCGSFTTKVHILSRSPYVERWPCVTERTKSWVRIIVLNHGMVVECTLTALLILTPAWRRSAMILSNWKSDAVSSLVQYLSSFKITQRTCFKTHIASWDGISPWVISSSRASVRDVPILMVEI